MPRVAVPQLIFCLVAYFACPYSLSADDSQLKLAVPFQSNMVLQRQKDVPVWGVAKPGSQVTVEFAGQTKSAKASPSGQWKLNLTPLTASRQGRDFLVSSGEQAIHLSNVLVGEVWFSSGQSNMVWLANSSMCRDLATELARAEKEVPIREISIDTVSALYPQRHAQSTDGWKTSKQAGSRFGLHHKPSVKDPGSIVGPGAPLQGLA